MNTPPADESPLSPQRAFVVQLRERTDVERGQWAGRVEHVTSGQAAHFESVEELLAFIVRILASGARDPPNEWVATLFRRGVVGSNMEF
jgi:hypothetical protein